MTKNTKIFLIALAVMIVTGGVLIYFANKSKNTPLSAIGNGLTVDDEGIVAGVTTEDGKTDEYLVNLAKFMTEKGMIMYGAYWCPHCQDQKELFAGAVEYIDYVECDAKGASANPDECAAQNITSYPTWVFQGVQYKGYKSLSELAKLSGFSN